MLYILFNVWAHCVPKASSASQHPRMKRSVVFQPHLIRAKCLCMGFFSWGSIRAGNRRFDNTKSSMRLCEQEVVSQFKASVDIFTDWSVSYVMDFTFRFMSRPHSSWGWLDSDVHFWLNGSEGKKCCFYYESPTNIELDEVQLKLLAFHIWETYSRD